MEKWQVALKAVSNRIGFTLDHNSRYRRWWAWNRGRKSSTRTLTQIIFRSEAKFIKMVVKEVGQVLTSIPSDEGREDDSLKKTKTYNFPLALPCAWFGSVVGLIGALLLGIGLLPEMVHRCASPAMVALAGQAGPVVAISSRWSR
ncbi:unnamed protein product [Arabis nemorensis]|uniref:Uncharacterized protein n=1 Tax=Arabis nemorensis TaxID=586526 RepID=A0A565BEJ4_9BRAS|nr:unnamed protein product [Arabis nemorensis]